MLKKCTIFSTIRQVFYKIRYQPDVYAFLFFMLAIVVIFLIKFYPVVYCSSDKLAEAFNSIYEALSIGYISGYFLYLLTVKCTNIVEIPKKRMFVLKELEKIDSSIESIFTILNNAAPQNRWDDLNYIINELKSPNNHLNSYINDNKLSNLLLKINKINCIIDALFIRIDCFSIDEFTILNSMYYHYCLLINVNPQKR